jgi:hypothetical protein
MKTVFFFIFALTVTNVLCQDYSAYYLKCNLSDSLLHLGDNQGALDEINRAFSSVDYVHSEKYINAYHLAIKLQKFDEAFEFGKMIIINSGNKNKIHTKSVDFKSSKYYRFLLDSTNQYLDRFNARVNHYYIEIIDSLHFIDQRIIRGNRSVKGKYCINKKSLPKNRFELDSTNWLTLSHLIDSLGFPSEQNVGSKAYYDAWIIIHHNLRLKKNTSYHEKIFEFIRNGDYLPEHFAFWYEQYQMQVNGRTFFTTWDEDISPENLKRIDMNRRSFFLKGINTFDIQNNGRKMVSKW